MHWGIRRYQPYTSSNRRKGGKTGKFVGKTRTKKDEKGDLATMAIAAGVYSIPIVAAMAAAGARHVKGSVNDSRAKKAIAHIEANKNVDPKTGLKRLDKPESIKDSMKRINTERQGNKDDLAANRQENCTSCAMALALRQKGYDVRAKEMPEGISEVKETMRKAFGAKNVCVNKTYDGTNLELKRKGETWLNMDKMTEEQKLSRNSASQGLNTQHAQAVKEWAKTQPDQSGQLDLRWGVGGGHATNYQITDGKIVIHDPQSNRTLKGSEMERWFKTSWTSDFYRLDDKQIKNAKTVKDMVYSGSNNSKVAGNKKGSSLQSMMLKNAADSLPNVKPRSRTPELGTFNDHMDSISKRKESFDKKKRYLNSLR